MILSLALLLAAATPAPVAAPPATTPSAWPTAEGDVTIAGFTFASGEKLDVRMHYTTLGTPRRDAQGRIDNAVMVLHGTGGTGKQFLQPQFADRLYGPGAPLDLAKTYVILPDSVGHGKSSKPSDGLRARFPRYTYADMVALQHRLLTDGLKVERLRLLMGTSMGCMHAFVWGETYPGFARAMMPTACLTVEIAGRNRMWRKLSIDAVRADPAYAGGDYKTQPVAGLRTAVALSAMAGSVPLRLQAELPTREAVDAAVERRVATDLAGRDANDLIYQLDASRDYNPSPGLAKITVPVVWINSADDFINPPGLGIAEREVKKMPRATFRLIPESVDGRGHSTHTWADFWIDDLKALLEATD